MISFVGDTFNGERKAAEWPVSQSRIVWFEIRELAIVGDIILMT